MPGVLGAVAAGSPISQPPLLRRPLARAPHLRYCTGTITCGSVPTHLAVGELARRWRARIVHLHRADLRREAAVADHVAREARRLLQVARRAGALPVAAKDEHLSHLAAEADVDACTELRERARELVRRRRLPRQPERVATGVDRRFVERVGAGCEERDERVARLMVRSLSDRLLRKANSSCAVIGRSGCNDPVALIDSCGGARSRRRPDALHLRRFCDSN